jgi:hypothetical protein
MASGLVWAVGGLAVQVSHVAAMGFKLLGSFKPGEMDAAVLSRLCEQPGAVATA